MNCLHCKTHNPSEAKFCMNCGNPLGVHCGMCGNVNPFQAKYCIECGKHLSHSSTPAQEIQDPVHQLIPKEYAEKLELARNAQSVQGERRIVTILFSDVKGSTAMADRLDPEEWTEIMNQAFEYLITPIYKYEGTLARLMGDSILAFFGAPIAHEDDAQRAILAGMDILDGIRPFREKIVQQYGLDFNVRVGINTGLVVVGDVGSDLFMEYTAQGDAINIAARMEQTAKPGTIQVAEDTYKKVSGLFDFEPIEGVTVKGKSDPVTVYRVLRVKEKPDRQRGFRGQETALIGRAHEIERISGALDALKQGRGQIISLVGEVGLGKSRLLRDAHRNWISGGQDSRSFEKLPSSWNQAAGVSYESSRPYGLIQRLIRNFLGVSTSDSPAAIRKSLEETLTLSGEQNSAASVNLFEILLGVQERTNGNQLEGETLKRAIHKEMLHTLGNLVQSEPTVIAIDDLHWSDQTSADLIEHLFQLVDSAPILFICAFRPDRSTPAWQIKQIAETNYAHRYLEIDLKPFSTDESNAFIDQLLNIVDLPIGIRQLILEKSDGNPFFMEEVIRSLVDNGVFIPGSTGDQWRVGSDVVDLTIPDNLHALLTARIDRLEDTAKRILQMASVIGRSFYHQVLEFISGTNGELDQELNSLQRLGLILEAAREPTLEYAFRQALTQETAYNTILLKHRREFHRRVGEALLQLYPEQSDEFATVLGHHFYEAQDQRALDYLKKAGDAAFRLYANHEAVTFYSKAIEVILWSPEPNVDLLADLFGSRGRTLELNSQFSEALENFGEMESAGVEYGSKSMQMTAQIAQAQIYSIPSNEFNLEAGLALTEKAGAMAEQIDDRPALAKITWIKANLYRFNQSLEIAQETGEQAIALARELGLDEQLAYSLTDTTHTYNNAGKIGRAKEVSLEASQLWRKLDNLPMLTDSLSGLASICVFSGDYDDANVYSDEAYEISTRIDNIWGQAYSRYVIGWVDFDRGDVDLALSRFEGSIKDSQAANFFIGEVLSSNFLATIYSELGNFELAQGALYRLYDHSIENSHLAKTFLSGAKLLAYVKTGNLVEARRILEDEKIVIDEAPFLGKHYYFLSQCYISLAEKKFKNAQKTAQKYLNLFQSTGIEYLSPELLLIIGISQSNQHRYAKAKKSLEQAYQIAESLGSRRTLWQIDYQLGLLSARQGDQIEADRYHQKAKANLDYIVDHISDDEIRESFLAKPDVLEVFEAKQRAS